MNCFHTKGEKIERKRGFTLIELLVVISIISLLSSIIIGNLNGARIKARNSYRNQTIHQYRLALELYRDTNGSFPAPNDATQHCAGIHPNGLCGYTSSLTQDAAINNALSPYLNGPPPLLPTEYQIAQSGTLTFRGPVYVCTNSGTNTCAQPISVTLTWYLEGQNASCGESGHIVGVPFGGITPCELNLF